jgi:hypothetical protein
MLGNIEFLLLFLSINDIKVFFELNLLKPSKAILKFVLVKRYFFSVLILHDLNLVLKLVFLFILSSSSSLKVFNT